VSEGILHGGDDAQAGHEDWRRGKLAKDATVPHRLAVILRDMLSRIVLTVTDKPRYGPATEPRKLEVVFRSPEEAAESFTMSTGGDGRSVERAPIGRQTAVPRLSLAARRGRAKCGSLRASA